MSASTVEDSQVNVLHHTVIRIASAEENVFDVAIALEDQFWESAQVANPLRHWSTK